MKTLLPGLLCALFAAGASAQQAPEIPKFSTMKPGGPPAEWKPLPLASFKKNTDYMLVTEDSVVVLHKGRVLASDSVRAVMEAAGVASIGAAFTKLTGGAGEEEA